MNEKKELFQVYYLSNDYEQRGLFNSANPEDSAQESGLMELAYLTYEEIKELQKAGVEIHTIFDDSAPDMSIFYEVIEK